MFESFKVNFTNNNKMEKNKMNQNINKHKFLL